MTHGVASVALFTHAFKAMGGPCEARAYAGSNESAQRAFAAVEAEVRRLEQRYSRYRDDSELSRINRSAGGAGITVDEETAALLDFAATAFEQSDGRFDITAGVLREAWDFKARVVPTEAVILKCLQRVGWEKVSWQRPRLVLPSGMELDLGGFVKEYAADTACRALQAAGVQHGLVDLAGDIAIAGPHPDGSPWRVGVRDPRAPGSALASVPLGDSAIATSGDYERFFEANGVRYCHILDARSGWPVQGLASVSVVAPQCLVAGISATVAMLKGVEQGPRWLADLGLPYMCVTREGEVSGTLA